MKRVWEWLKANYKWLILPLWVLSMVLVWVFTRGRTKVLVGTTDIAADQAVEAQKQAISDFRARLEEMARKAEARLASASKEQLQEFKDLQGKPLDEVAKWIDNLS